MRLSRSSTLSTNLPAARAWLFGGILVALGLALLLITTYSLLNQSGLYQLDTPVQQRFAAMRLGATDTTIDMIKLLGQIGSDGTTILALLIMAIALFRKQFRLFWLLLVSVGGGELIWVALVFAFNRPRPVPVTAFGGLDLPSYPSGHTVLAITLFVTLLHYYITSTRHRGRQIAFTLLVLAWAGLSGLIRLFLDVHYFTDVIAGYALGMAWTGLSILIVDGWKRASFLV